jgi:hypothetical protein
MKTEGEKRKARSNLGAFAGGIFFSTWFFFFAYIFATPILESRHELALIRHARLTTGFLVESFEDSDDEHVFEVGIYEYRTAGDRQFKIAKRGGEVEETVDVEYLPNAPEVSRVKGDGCQSIVEWVIRKIILGGIMLAVFVGGGVWCVWEGVRVGFLGKEWRSPT